MKTSRSSSRCGSGRFFFAAAALVVQPFGSIPELLKDSNPWRGFHAEGPLLTVVRAQSVSLGGAEGDCAGWVGALVADTIGRNAGSATGDDWRVATDEWGPWKKEEIESMESCSEIPCDVKLNAQETAQMAAVKPRERQGKYLELAQGRVRRYLKSQERKEYEFVGDPVDPWKLFEPMGFKTQLAMPATVKLELRKVDFLPGKVKTLHQAFDTRVTVSPDRREAVLWRRDVITDHYFDSWGEWAQVCCDASTVTVVFGALLELDLIKKTDLFSRIMRPKMRGATEDGGVLYFTQWFERLRKRARAGIAASIPRPSPSSLSDKNYQEKN